MYDAFDSVGGASGAAKGISILVMLLVLATIGTSVAARFETHSTPKGPTVPILKVGDLSTVAMLNDATIGLASAAGFFSLVLVGLVYEK